MIARLSDLLRHTLEQTSEQEIPLEREGDLLRRYLDIMEVRFQGRLEVSLEIDDDVRNALVPNFVLQPLVENALKHGVDATTAPRASRFTPGVLATMCCSACATTVLASLPRRTGPAVSGLRNTTARLTQLYGERHRFSLRAGESGGTVAEITLPFRSAARQTNERPFAPRRSSSTTSRSRSSASRISSRHDRDVEIVGTASTGPTAVETIRRTHPDLVFLDVQMPGMSGFEVARTLGDAMPATVFVTAFDQHALKAFELAALDYLVKPFDDERFEESLRRARHMIDLEATRRMHERILDVLQAAPVARGDAKAPEREGAATDAPLERIPVESRGKVKFVPVGDVDYIAASGPYAEVVTASRRYLVREPMQALEDRLDPLTFMRIHRSSIVRVDRIDTLLRGAGGDYEVLLKDGTRLRVARSRREALEQRLGLRA